MIGIYLEIGQWKFNPVSGPTRQIVKARFMPDTVGFQSLSRGIGGRASRGVEVTPML
jgi:hypothetical protein